jgi:hypothetical protein
LRSASTEQREEIGAALDFVNDHQTFERAQGRVRLGEAGKGLRIFQIEIVE